jgi:hypothetical protein
LPGCRRRYFVRGRLWRIANTGLDEAERPDLVSLLMAARRAVRVAGQTVNIRNQPQSWRPEKCPAVSCPTHCSTIYGLTHLSPIGNAIVGPGRLSTTISPSHADDSGGKHGLCGAPVGYGLNVAVNAAPGRMVNCGAVRTSAVQWDDAPPHVGVMVDPSVAVRTCAPRLA